MAKFDRQSSSSFKHVAKHWAMNIVFNVNLEELNSFLVGETSHLGRVLRERDGSD